MRKRDAKNARRLAFGETGMGPLVNTKHRAEAHRQIANLEQNDRVIELLTQIAADIAAARAAVEYIARNTPPLPASPARPA